MLFNLILYATIILIGLICVIDIRSDEIFVDIVEQWLVLCLFISWCL